MNVFIKNVNSVNVYTTYNANTHATDNIQRRVIRVTPTEKLHMAAAFPINSQQGSPLQWLWRTRYQIRIMPESSKFLEEASSVLEAFGWSLGVNEENSNVSPCPKAS